MNTNLNIDMAPAIEDARKAAKKAVEDSLMSKSRLVVSNLMNDGRYNGKEGLGHEILRKRIEDYVLSDKFIEKLDVIVEEVADAEMTSAVATLINSRTRKLLFQATAPLDTKNESELVRIDGLTYPIDSQSGLIKRS